MKIKTRRLPYEQVMALPRPKHQDPLRPNVLFRTLIRLLSIPSLLFTHFTFRMVDMHKAGDQPCLILMNHSSFIDLKIAYRLFYPKPLCIVGTTDSLVGKKWLMRLIGIIPTQKFVSDMTLIRDMRYALTELKSSVLMFPEAGYSLDGRSTVLPRHLGVLLKRMKAPVVTVTTWGAFARDPLYNGLQLRKVRVSAEARCILTPQEIQEKSLEELDALIDQAFSFDQFAWQRDNRVPITEPFRADGLHRMLYKCAACGAEGAMEGKGTRLTCHRCGKAYEMDAYGQLKALNGKTEFPHIPHWFDWQRAQVRKALQEGAYHLDTPVDIAMLVDHKALYQVGEGRLQHGPQGFVLTGCDGKLHYEQSPLASHTLNVDYFWYELGDVIAIGDQNALYYCFPKGNSLVTKARLAAEELYRLARG
ncbi:MAG: 1-acyl-sn-glycerol-3-phosphate acyltransferase [Clostridia bacterium]|nr:1-acyl-sn-glycerol-3-phosphate acyltransferase [Clostridia bacterium]